MARLGWVYSYKKTTIIVCSINIVAALYVLHSLYSSLYLFSGNASNVEYTEDQIRRMDESIRIRKEAEPRELVKLVKKTKEELSGEEKVDLSLSLKQKLADEILQRLKELDRNTTVVQQREVLEIWRNEKLKEAIEMELGNATLNPTIPKNETEVLKKALESEWDVLLEYIGVWMPVEIINKEQDEKPEGEVDLEDQIIPGRPIAPECHAEVHTDYAGVAVRWGLTHHKESAADCCQACLAQAKGAKEGEMKCNIWVYCPKENGCHSPDIYEHRHQECWLKMASHCNLVLEQQVFEALQRYLQAPIHTTRKRVGDDHVDESNAGENTEDVVKDDPPTTKRLVQRRRSLNFWWQTKRMSVHNVQLAQLTQLIQQLSKMVIEKTSQAAPTPPVTGTLQAEKPTVTFKDKYSDSYRQSHPSAPQAVPWIAGVVSA